MKIINLPASALRLFEKMKRGLAVGACLLAAAALMVIGSSPADAHAISASTIGGNGGVQANHVVVFACDTSADGWGVRTRYTTSTGGKDHLGDKDGSAGGCGFENVSGGGRVTSFEVCSGPDGKDTFCSAVKSA